MDPKDTKDILELNEQKITAEYLWSLNHEEREKCLYDVYNHYRSSGFPFEMISDSYIINQYAKLIKFKTSNVVNSDGYISNSGNLCLDVCDIFVMTNFF